MTITERIIADHAHGPVRAGQVATVSPDILLLNDVSGPLAFDQFGAMAATAPFDASVARILFRNAINLGLVVLAVPDADLAAGGLREKTHAHLRNNATLRKELAHG